MKRFSKNSVIKLFAAAVIVFGLVLLELWVWLLKPPSLTSLDFLKGRAVTACIESDPRKSPLAVTGASGEPIYYCSRAQYYSFKANFSDVCKAADAELLPLGFKTRTYPKHWVYSLRKNTLDKTVVIHNGRRFVKSMSAHTQESSFRHGYAWESGDEWVTVVISRGRLPLWPPRYLLYRLKKQARAVLRVINRVARPAGRRAAGAL